MPPTKVLKGTRSDGERSRREILATAARVATVHGIRHLSIAQLAEEVGMSKSGLYAHFGSKEELQLATIDTAEEIYERDVYDRIRDVPPGLDGAIALADAHLDHMRRRVFPGRLLLRRRGGRHRARARPDPRPGGRVPDRLGGAAARTTCARPRPRATSARTRTSSS